MPRRHLQDGHRTAAVGLLLDSLRTLWVGLDIVSMDATNYSLYDMGTEDGGTVPAFGGNSETNRNDLVQKNIHAITNGNGLLRAAKPFKGTISDIRMNDDMIGFLADKVDPERTVIPTDCKLANETTIDNLLQLRWGFVTKAPSSFNGLVNDSVADVGGNRIHGRFEDVSGGRFLYDTEAPYKEGGS